MFEKIEKFTTGKLQAFIRELNGSCVININKHASIYNSPYSCSLENISNI